MPSNDPNERRAQAAKPPCRGPGQHLSPPFPSCPCAARAAPGATDRSIWWLLRPLPRSLSLLIEILYHYALVGSRSSSRLALPRARGSLRHRGFLATSLKIVVPTVEAYLDCVYLDCGWLVDGFASLSGVWERASVGLGLCFILHLLGPNRRVCLSEPVHLEIPSFLQNSSSVSPLVL